MIASFPSKTKYFRESLGPRLSSMDLQNKLNWTIWNIEKLIHLSHSNHLNTDQTEILFFFKEKIEFWKPHMVEKPLVPIPAVLLFLLTRSVQFLAHGLLSSKYTPEIRQTELIRRAEI